MSGSHWSGFEKNLYRQCPGTHLPLGFRCLGTHTLPGLLCGRQCPGTHFPLWPLCPGTQAFPAGTGTTGFQCAATHTPPGPAWPGAHTKPLFTLGRQKPLIQTPLGALWPGTQACLGPHLLPTQTGWIQNTITTKNAIDQRNNLCFISLLLLSIMAIINYKTKETR